MTYGGCIAAQAQQNEKTAASVVSCNKQEGYAPPGHRQGAHRYTVFERTAISVVFRGRQHTLIRLSPLLVDIVFTSEEKSYLHEG